MPSTKKSQSISATQANLPPPQPKELRGLRPVSKPLSNTRLNRLVYLLVFLSTLLTAYYSWRVFVWKTEVGGWWDMTIGRRPSYVSGTVADGEMMQRWSWKRFGGGGHANPRQRLNVEESINALAAALGVSPKDLASAIAGAVRAHVPPASLSSVAKAEGTSVNALFGAAEDSDEEKRNDARVQGVMGSVVSGMDRVVGLDEPPDIVQD